jgi:hypothetical protein
MFLRESRAFETKDRFRPALAYPNSGALRSPRRTNFKTIRNGSRACRFVCTTFSPYDRHFERGSSIPYPETGIALNRVFDKVSAHERMGALGRFLPHAGCLPPSTNTQILQYSRPSLSLVEHYKTTLETKKRERKTGKFFILSSFACPPTVSDYGTPLH